MASIAKQMKRFGLSSLVYSLAPQSVTHHWPLSTIGVAAAVVVTLELPARTLVSELDLRPTNPSTLVPYPLTVTNVNNLVPAACGIVSRVQMEGWYGW